MTRYASLLLSLLVVSLVVSGTGCLEVDAGDSCGAARRHLESCFGQSAAGALAACDPARAEALLDRDCSGLAELMLDGKADSPVEDEVRAAIRSAIREAIVEGVKQALQAALSSLGSTLKNYDLYLVLGSETSKAAAEARADELTALFSGASDFRPTLFKSGKRTYILHGPCPLDLASDLPRTIAELAVGNPKLLAALGGEVTISTEAETGSTRSSTVSLHLPLQLLPIPRGTSLGCSK